MKGRPCRVLLPNVEIPLQLHDPVPNVLDQERLHDTPHDGWRFQALGQVAQGLALLAMGLPGRPLTRRIAVEHPMAARAASGLADGEAVCADALDVVLERAAHERRRGEDVVAGLVGSGCVQRFSFGGMGADVDTRWGSHGGQLWK